MTIMSTATPHRRNVRGERTAESIFSALYVRPMTIRVLASIVGRSMPVTYTHVRRLQDAKRVDVVGHDTCPHCGKRGDNLWGVRRAAS